MLALPVRPAACLGALSDCATPWALTAPVPSSFPQRAALEQEYPRFKILHGIRADGIKREAARVVEANSRAEPRTGPVAPLARPSRAR